MDPLAPQTAERRFLGAATAPAVTDKVDRHLPAPGAGPLVRGDLRPVVVRPQHRLLGDVARQLAITGQREPERHHHRVLAPEERVVRIAPNPSLARLRHRAHA